MKVYSVIRHQQWESTCLLAVFGSREECLEYTYKQEAFQKDWYDYGIIESELGQEIDMFGTVEWVEK